MVKDKGELCTIINKFAASDWDLIDAPATRWLENPEDEAARAALTEAITQADALCGSCGCEFDALYKKALELLSE